MKVRVSKKQKNSKMCFICGLENKYGLKASFYELENNKLVGYFSACEYHQGYPGRLHGGLASAILDEAIGRAFLIDRDDLWGVTIELNIKYRKPIPLNEKIKIVCELTSENSRFFEGEGQILLSDGSVAVRAHGKYIKMSADKITSDEFDKDQWFMNIDKNDPQEIELSDK